MYQKFTAIGRLGKPVELRYTPQGTPVGNFSIACDRKYKQGEEWKTDTFWGDVVVWGKQAENCSQFRDKSSLVFIEGRLQTRKWEADGRTHYKTEIIAETVKFLDKKGTGSQGVGEVAPDETTGIEPF